MVAATDPKYKNYLQDLGFLLKEWALQAKQDRDEAETAKGRESKDYMFQLGRLMAYQEVISLMRNQAAVFGIDLQDLKLQDIDVARDLI